MTTAVILRRKKLGKTSCNGIVQFSHSDIQVVRNDAVIPAADVYIRWGCTSTIPHIDSSIVVNTTGPIHTVGDKAGFRAILDAVALCPRTWFDVLDVPPRECPVIVRPQVHAQGKQVYFCESSAQMFNAIERCGPGYYISKFIDKVAEYRVFVAQGRAVWVAKKTPGNPEDVAWNVARGGRFDNVRWSDWPIKGVKLAIRGFLLSELDFGGVDIMVDAENNWYILEINSAPSQTSPYRQECVAKVFDYIIENGKDTIPIADRIGGYLKFIHPTLDYSAY